MADISEIMQVAQERNFKLSKGQIDFMQSGLESKKVSGEYLIDRVNQWADKRDHDGYAWYSRNEPKEGKPMLYYRNDTDPTAKAYVFERTNSETGEKFYVANRIDAEGKHLTMSTGAIDKVKSHVETYYNVAIIKQVEDLQKTQGPDKTFTKEPIQPQGPKKESMEVSM
jgi:hypothetical protein